MTHLTAAHPTMPLPSYARVTNMKNGSSVIVRVNDRGPYSHDRLIDLSKRAAELLDYSHIGTAKVKVEYIGRAPLDGHDDQYLMASYRPGNRAPDPSDGLPAGVMIAMNGPTPSANVGGAVAFPGMLSDSAAVAASSSEAFGTVPLPAFGPIAPERPAIGLPFETRIDLPRCPMRRCLRPRRSMIFAALEQPDNVGRRCQEAPEWTTRRMPSAGYIAAGSFTTARDAEQLARSLSAYRQDCAGNVRNRWNDWYSVNLYADGRNSVDAMLEAAWSIGASDAMTIRD